MTKNLWKIQWLIWCLPLVWLSGCATPAYKPAVVVNNTILNPTVGWKGYSIAVPEGYEVFNPRTATIKDPELLALLNNRFKLSGAPTEQPGEMAVKDVTFLFNEAQRATIIFHVLTIQLPGALSQVDGPTHERVLSEHLAALQKRTEMQNIQFEEEQDQVVGTMKKERASRQILDKRIVRFGDDLGCIVSGESIAFRRDGTVRKERTEEYIIVGSLDELYILAGTSDVRTAVDLTASMNAMAKSLKH